MLSPKTGVGLPRPRAGESRSWPTTRADGLRHPQRLVGSSAAPADRSAATAGVALDDPVASATPTASCCRWR